MIAPITWTRATERRVWVAEAPGGELHQDGARWRPSDKHKETWHRDRRLVRVWSMVASS